MKPKFISHESYQNFILAQLQTHYADGILVLRNNDWPIIHEFWITDLSYVIHTVDSSYSTKGPKPRDPVSLLRSYLLFLMVSPYIGITKWVDELYRVPLYAILSGFEPGNIPGVGTFYDFFTRIWGSPSPNTKPSILPKKMKMKKGKKLKKGEKKPPKNPGIVKKLVDHYLKHGSKKNELPTDKLFDFFQSQILAVSAKLGLLGDLNDLAIAGDGTPVETCRYPRSKSTCDCFKNGITNCSHHRFHSQPDIDSGWDSSREKYYNGYDLYMISACDSYYDLPIYPKLNPASRHDSVSLLLTLNELNQRFTINPIGKILLDSAHDALAIYQVLNSHDIEPFIDLNPRTKHNISTDCDIQISTLGIPICPCGHPMKSNGFEKAKNRKKWRCPLANGTKITCQAPCSTAKYGRTFHTSLKDNPRIYTKTPRGSDVWNNTYKRRTSVERSNKREKVDYHLENGRHRSTKMWSIRLYAIMVCQHMDAWFSHLKNDLDLKKIIFA